MFINYANKKGRMKKLKVKGRMMKHPDPLFDGPGVYSCYGHSFHDYLLADSERDAIMKSGTHEVYPMIPLLVQDIPEIHNYQYPQCYISIDDKLSYLKNVSKRTDGKVYKHVLLGHLGYTSKKEDYYVPEYIIKQMLTNSNGEFWLPINDLSYPAHGEEYKNLIRPVQYHYSVAEVNRIIDELEADPKNVAKVREKHNL